MGNGDISQEGFWYLHDFFKQTAKYMDVELEDTRYDEEAVHPQAINSKKNEHKEAIYLLSEAFARDREEFTPMGTWQDAVEEPEPDISHENIAYFSNDIRDEVRFLRESDDVSYDIYHNGKEEYRWNMLEELAGGMKIKSALRKHYEDPAKRSNQAPYHQLHRKVLEDGLLPDEYRSDLSKLLTDLGRRQTPVGK